jgi:RNA recognition motif-containing protein
VLTGCVWRGSDALRGFAFIQFEEPDDAKQAMDNMHESELYGRVLTVNIAKPQAASYNRAGMCVWSRCIEYGLVRDTFIDAPLLDCLTD